MSIALVTTRGFGNGTLIGSLTKLVTVGFAISTIIPPDPTAWINVLPSANNWVTETEVESSWVTVTNTSNTWTNLP
jgi:hypothetical protein